MATPMRDEYVDRVPGMPMLDDPRAGLPLRSTGWMPTRVAAAVILVVLSTAALTIGVAMYDPRLGLVAGGAVGLVLGVLLGMLP